MKQQTMRRLEELTFISLAGDPIGYSGSLYYLNPLNPVTAHVVRNLQIDGFAK